MAFLRLIICQEILREEWSIIKKTHYIQKTWVYYVVYLLVILTAIYLYINSEFLLYERKPNSLKFNYSYDIQALYLIEVAKLMAFGMLISFDSFIDNVYTNCKWTVNWKKLLIVGLPVLLFSGIIPCIHTYIWQFAAFLHLNPMFLYLAKPFSPRVFFQIAFGAIFLTSFSKNVIE